MAESDINTIPKLAQRAKADGLPVSEYTIRRLIREGTLPARYVGPKAIASYSALVRYLSCADGCDNVPNNMGAGSGIRRVEL
jgi:hypothetical protein